MSVINSSTSVNSIASIAPLELPLLEQFESIINRFNADVARVVNEKEQLELQKNALKKNIFKRSASFQSIERLALLIKLKNDQLQHSRNWIDEAARWNETYKRTHNIDMADTTRLEYLQSANQRYCQWQRINSFYEKKIAQTN